MLGSIPGNSCSDRWIRGIVHGSFSFDGCIGRCIVPVNPLWQTIVFPKKKTTDQGQGQFNQRVARHELFKKKYPDVSNAKGIPYTGLSKARPETKAMAYRVKAVADAMPFYIEEYLKFDIPGSDKVGDWGNKFSSNVKGYPFDSRNRLAAFAANRQSWLESAATAI
jgi:hypothetical protein